MAMTRTRSRALIALSVPTLTVASLVALSPTAHGSTRLGARESKSAPGSSGAFKGVTTVPHSSDVWAFGYAGPSAEARLLVARRHGGKWKRVKAPKMNVSEAFAIAAGSSHSVWFGGAATRFNRPAIFAWKGNHFAAAKLPKLHIDAQIASISASSASNAWAVGHLTSTATDLPVALHWNGKKWAGVATPEALTHVSTSSPTNAWAVGADGDMMHWDGKSWAADGVAPTYATLNGIATTSSKRAYAVGSNSNGGAGVPLILRYNGSAWSSVKLPKGIPHDSFSSVTMHGRAAWAVSPHLIVHTSGKAWKAQQRFGKHSSESLGSISTSSASHPWTVGVKDAFTNGVLTGGKTIAETYSGHKWKSVSAKF